jgi:UDP-N-acetylglucosamine transferase subunit ALG13
MIFLTVGTQFPFDRLVQAVDKAVDHRLLDEEVFGQIGDQGYQPRNFESVGFLRKQVFDERLRTASSIISHAGIGIITSALEYNKPLLVMPRLRRYGEVVHDHQVALARKFELLGHILVADEAEEIPVKIEQLKTFTPCKRSPQPQQVIEQIAQFLNGLSNEESQELT